MKQLWTDDRGALIATEFLFLATILVLGIVVGLTALRNAVVNEFEDFAGAVGALSQAYSFSGTSGCCGAFTNGSFFIDQQHTYSVSTCTQASDFGSASCAD